MAFTPNDDLNIIQASDSANVSAGAGNDTYIVSPATIGAGQQVTITDTEGTNTLQLVGGLSITSSQVANDALQLTLSNGAVVTLLSASAFNFNVGGNVLASIAGTDKDYATFAQEDLGVTVPAEGEDPVDGGEATIGDETPTEPTEGETFTLTTDTDTVIGTDGDDTVEGAVGTVQNADTIIDQSTTDNDTANLVLNAAYTPANITNIENVTFDWDAFGTATVDATNISGANALTFTSSKLGYLGNVTVNNAGDNTIVAGSGANGALDVNGGKTVVVNAEEAKTVTVDAAATDAVSAAVTAGANTTTIDVGSATAFATTTVTGGAATTSVEVNGTAGSSDVADVTVSTDSTLGFLTADVETVNITAADGNKLTLADASLLDTVTLTSAGAVTLIAGSDELTTHTLTNSTTGLTIDLTSDAAADLSKVQYDLLNLKNALAGNLTVASGATIKAGVDLTGTGDILATTGTSDVVNLTATVDQSRIDTTDGTNDVETLNLTVDAAATETDGEIDVTTFDVVNAVVTGASKVNLGNVAATSVDLSAVTGEVTLSEVAGSTTDITVVGSSTAKNTVTFTTTTADTSYTGGEGADSVTMGQTTGDSTVVLGNGANTYTNTGLTTGTAVVLGGAGVDTITLTATGDGVTTPNAVIQSGAGADVVTLSLASAANAEQATVELGAGDDSIKLTSATGAGDNLAIDGGDGTDSVDLNALDLTDGSITLSNVEVLDDSAGTATVDGALLDEKTFTIKGDGSLSTLLDVDLDAAGEYDFSGLVLDASLADGIGGLNITGNAGNDTIVATSGNDTIASNGGNDTITGGAGADSMTGGAGTDTFVIASADTGITLATSDSVASFTSTTDKLKLGTAGTATNYVEADGNTATATFADAQALADTAMDGTVKYYFVYDVDADLGNGASADGLLFVDADMDGTADDSIVIVGGATDAALAFGDIIA